jgi:hypothetical protein
MRYDIISYAGAGNLRLGMTIVEIESLCGASLKKIRRGSDEGLLTDAYPEFFVYYKKPGLCSAIEFHKPAAVFFNGVNLLDEPYARVLDAFKKLDKNISIDKDGLTSNKLGIGLYSPSFKEVPSLPAESVIIFERGYYD